VEVDLAALPISGYALIFYWDAFSARYRVASTCADSLAY
jgi:hypothetical protein